MSKPPLGIVVHRQGKKPLRQLPRQKGKDDSVWRFVPNVPRHMLPPRVVDPTPPPPAAFQKRSSQVPQEAPAAVKSLFSTARHIERQSKLRAVKAARHRTRCTLVPDTPPTNELTAQALLRGSTPTLTVFSSPSSLSESQSASPSSMAGIAAFGLQPTLLRTATATSLATLMTVGESPPDTPLSGKPQGFPTINATTVETLDHSTSVNDSVTINMNNIQVPRPPMKSSSSLSPHSPLATDSSTSLLSGRDISRDSSHKYISMYRWSRNTTKVRKNPAAELVDPFQAEMRRALLQYQRDFLGDNNVIEEEGGQDMSDLPLYGTLHPMRDLQLASDLPQELRHLSTMLHSSTGGHEIVPVETCAGLPSKDQPILDVIVQKKSPKSSYIRNSCKYGGSWYLPVDEWGSPNGKPPKPTLPLATVAVPRTSSHLDTTLPTSTLRSFLPKKETGGHSGGGEDERRSSSRGSAATVDSNVSNMDVRNLNLKRSRASAASSDTANDASTPSSLEPGLSMPKLPRTEDAEIIQELRRKQAVAVKLLRQRGLL